MEGFRVLFFTIKKYSLTMKKIDAFIIGSQKSGTSSLFDILKQHNKIVCSEPKENVFFSQERFFNKGEKYLLPFFDTHTADDILLSADVQMLVNEKSIERLKSYNPKVKIIISLRDPVHRAYSAFNFAKQKGIEKSDSNFMDVFRSENNDSNYKRNEKSPFDYFYDGLYYKHISLWMNHFPKENIFICTMSELKNSPKMLFDKLFSFFELETQEVNLLKRTNQTGDYKYKWIHRLLLNPDSKLHSVGSIFNGKTKLWIRKNIFNKIRKVTFKQVDIKKLDNESYLEVYEYYKDDLTKLNTDFGIDLQSK